MKRLFRQSFITRAALFVMGISLLVLIAASLIFVSAGKNMITSIMQSEESAITAIIDTKTFELKGEMERTIKTNLETLSMIAAGFLYNYELKAVEEVLHSYANIPEVKRVRLIELPTGKELFLREKEPENTNVLLTIEKEIRYKGEPIGKIIVFYSEAEVEARAVLQKEAMLTKQKEVQKRIVGASSESLTFYAVVFGMILLLSILLVLLVLIYLDREVSRKNTELERINSSLEDRVAEEIKKNRDSEQLLIEQSKMAAMGEMIGAIAHQWRQPLNALGLYVQDIKDAYQHNELDEYYIGNTVRDSMRQINYMSKTIDDFRDFYKPSKMQEYFSVGKSVDTVLNLLYPQFKTLYISRVEINNDIEKEDRVIGYKSEFEQVILNIFNNTQDAFLEAQETKGFDLEDSLIDIHIKEEEGAIVVAVDDNAGGVEEAILNRIFEPYFTTKEEGKGTGIGLYMSKLIIEKNMHGSLSAKNIEWKNGGRGLRMEIRLKKDPDIKDSGSQPGLTGGEEQV